MRSARVIAVCVGVTLLAAGCDPLDRRYFREGIGTDLYTSELPERTQVQDLYVGYICHQAGLSVIPSGGRIPLCDEGVVTPAGWMMFVQTGMNDIDTRCDSYLAWLDAKRRSSTAILQQISDTRTATEAILAYTAAGPTAIAIVGTAFGFAAQTFTNITSRLLLEVDQSTVQTVVLTRQKQFREDLPRVIDNRAAAIYALRSYLRLCMPMTIETQINTTVKLFERGGVPALRDAQANPMIDARVVRTATIRSATAPIAPPPRTPQVVDSVRVGQFEQRLTAGEIRDFQKVVCQTVDGKFSATTRAAILTFLNTNNVKDQAFPDRITAKDGTRLRDALDAGPRC
jgi:hypothetical protein